MGGVEVELDQDGDEVDPDMPPLESTDDDETEEEEQHQSEEGGTPPGLRRDVRPRSRR